MLLTVVPDADRDDTFAIIFSGSHLIMDGFTYYKLLAMLSSDGTISKLCVSRKLSFDSFKREKRDEMDALTKIGCASAVACRFIATMFRLPLIENYYIDDKKIVAAKSNATGVDFVSTNDIITASFGRATSPGLLLMPTNERNRLNYSSEDAGNYISDINIERGNYEDPGMIRKAVRSHPLPESFAGLPGKLMLGVSHITNFAFPFFSEVTMGTSKQIIHLPVIEDNWIVGLIINYAVIYRPKAGRLAVLFNSRAMRSADIQSDCPFGAKISSAENGKSKAVVSRCCYLDISMRTWSCGLVIAILGGVYLTISRLLLSI